MTQDSTQTFTDRFSSATHIYYGWVVVAVTTLIIALAYGTMYSYSVFFKPIVDHFNWDRATVSSVYSVSLVLRGLVSIGVGWLADRYGAVKLTAFCGIGRARPNAWPNLWQLYLTYGLILSIGLSGAFIIGSAVTSRWFLRKRAVALAIVSTGSGMGTLIIVPLSELLIRLYSWSSAFIIFGIIMGIIVFGCAFLLARPSQVISTQNKTSLNTGIGLQSDRTLKQAAFSREMIMLVMIFSMMLLCMQMIMIHLVNHATDMGINSLKAAGFISMIGVVSIFGRLIMGSASAKIGTHNSMIICIVLCLISLAWLFFCKSIFHFYIFTLIFGFSYGGEVPLIPLFIGQYFGIKAMAALIGLLIFAGNLGGALGPLLGGKIYDLTGHYHYAFGVALAASLLALVLVFLFKRIAPPARE